MTSVIQTMISHHSLTESKLTTLTSLIVPIP